MIFGAATLPRVWFELGSRVRRAISITGSEGIKLCGSEVEPGGERWLAEQRRGENGGIEFVVELSVEMAAALDLAGGSKPGINEIASEAIGRWLGDRGCLAREYVNGARDQAGVDQESISGRMVSVSAASLLELANEADDLVLALGSIGLLQLLLDGAVPWAAADEAVTDRLGILAREKLGIDLDRCMEETERVEGGMPRDLGSVQETVIAAVRWRLGRMSRLFEVMSRVC